MKKLLFITGLISLMCTGCLSLCQRCEDWDGYYMQNESVKVPGTNDWYRINTFTVYNGTCHLLYTLDSPLRLFTKPPKGPEATIAEAYMVLFWPLELIDTPCEFVFDTLFLPVDIYYHIEANKYNKAVKAKYGIED